MDQLDLEHLTEDEGRQVRHMLLERQARNMLPCFLLNADLDDTPLGQGTHPNWGHGTKTPSETRRSHSNNFTKSETITYFFTTAQISRLLYRSCRIECD